MNNKLSFILQQGEGYKIEFKESIKHIGKEMVAFANAEGATILIGVDDQGNIKRTPLTNKLRSQLHDLAKNCDPAIKIDLEQKGDVPIIHIKEGNDKPYRWSSGFYLRQGPNSQKLKRDEIMQFALQQGKIRFDGQKVNDARFPPYFDDEKLDAYLKLAKLSKSIPTEDILISLGVAAKEQGKIALNNAGALFFAKNPKKWFMTSKITCVNYQTNEKVNILDRKIFDDGIIGNIEEAVRYVKKHIDVAFEIKSIARKEIPQYPEEAIRECVVNAIMHRDYLDKSGDTLIENFRNKIVVSNPRGLVKWMKPEEFGTGSRTRNTIIATLLSRTEYVEKLGTGITRIKKAMQDAKLPEPEFRYNGSFYVTLYDQTEAQKSSVKILTAMAENKLITIRELAEDLGISDRAVKKQIRKLQEEGLIKRIGPDKGGHWEVGDYDE